MKGYIIILALFPIISADKTRVLTRRQRIENAERDLALLKLKTEGAEEEILHNSDKISVLNTTVMELEKCFIGELDKPSKTSHIKGRVLTEDDTHDKHGGRVLDAFKQEKLYVREHVHRMSEAFDGFKEEVMKTAEADALALNHKAETITSELDDLREKLNLSEKKQNSEINSLKSSLETVSTELTASNSLKSSLETVTAEQSDLQTLVIQMMQQLNAIHLSIPCPDGWTKHSKFCYKYFDDRVTFDTAKKTCGRHNAHVVDVQNEKEMEFVKGLVRRSAYFWLGLTDKDAEGTWVWERTGAVAQYLNWNPGQPESSSDDEDCVLSGTQSFDKWSDAYCNSRYYTYPCVCKK